MISPIQQRLDILERMLEGDGQGIPPACNCAIQSRVEKHHLPDCPYRALKELIPMVRAAQGKTAP